MKQGKRVLVASFGYCTPSTPKRKETQSADPPCLYSARGSQRYGSRERRDRALFRFFLCVCFFSICRPKGGGPSRGCRSRSRSHRWASGALWRRRSFSLAADAATAAAVAVAVAAADGAAAAGAAASAAAAAGSAVVPGQ